MANNIQNKKDTMAGYNGYSKSNNAVDAESEGRYPLTQAARIVARETGITVKEARSILESIGTSEYHHSSKFFNAVDYYDTEEPIRFIKHMKMNGFETYEIAQEDLEEKDAEREEQRMEELERQAGIEAANREKCEHEFETKFFFGKGGVQTPHHYRCIKCGTVKAGK